MVLGIIIFAASVIIMLSMLVEGFAGFVASAVGVVLGLAVVAALASIIPAGLAYLFEHYMGMPFWFVFWIALIVNVAFGLLLKAVRSNSVFC